MQSQLTYLFDVRFIFTRCLDALLFTTYRRRKLSIETSKKTTDHRKNHVQSESANKQMGHKTHEKR